MILTCPECATRYFAPDGSVGANGRTVRCASCGHSWRAMPEGEAPLELATPVEPEPAPEPARAEKPSELPADELPKAFRERVKARKETRKAAASGVVWGLAAAGVVAALGGLVVARAEVVRFWPKSASAYALIGLRVNATGLVIEDESVSSEFAAGKPVLVVRGTIRNTTRRDVTAPPLHLVLLDANDKPVSRKISQVENPNVPAGAARYFQEAVLEPPSSVAGVELTFALGDEAKPKKAGLRKAEGHAAPAAAHAPSPAHAPAADDHAPSADGHGEAAPVLRTADHAPDAHPQPAAPLHVDHREVGP